MAVPRDVATRSRSLTIGSHSTTRPPYPSTACFFTAGAVRGITMVAGIPRSRAASASAWAWFPLLCVTTPRSAVAASSFRTAFVAPRYLKLPVFWKFSHLKNSRRPLRRSRGRRRPPSRR